MIQFANPTFLWALAGLVIPIGIHLLSRKEGKVIRLGSLRHLEETSTQQFKGFRLNELLLLFLRCTLIMILGLLLSGLQFNQSRNERWLVIEKGLEATPDIKTTIDSLQKQGYEPHWLANDFPAFQDSLEVSATVNYWKLSATLASRNLQEVIVISANKADNFKGSRASLPAHIRWINYPLPPLDYALQAIQTSPDSILIRSGHTRATGTDFNSQNFIRPSSALDAEPIKTISVLLVSDETHAYDKKILNAAFTAIGKSIPVNIKVTSLTSGEISSFPQTDWCVWLADAELPTSPTPKLIYLKPQQSIDLIIMSGPNQWIVTQRLNEEVALKHNMTLALASLIVPDRSRLEEIASKKDRRVLPDQIAWAPLPLNESTREAGIGMASANPHLLVILLFVLLIERIISYKRNQ